MRPSDPLVYVVRPQESHWTIGFGNGENIGRFGTRREALRSAVHDAIRVRRMGYEVEVVATRVDGSLRRVPEGIGIADP